MISSPFVHRKGVVAIKRRHLHLVLTGNVQPKILHLGLLSTKGIILYKDIHNVIIVVIIRVTNVLTCIELGEEPTVSSFVIGVLMVGSLCSSPLLILSF